MERNLPSKSVLRCCARALAMTVVGVGSMNPGASARAQETNDARALADLERAFWLCDYTASTRRVDLATALACGSIHDELKLGKFGGDYDALLAWWRLNKETMHRTVALGSRSVPQGNVPQGNVPQGNANRGNAIGDRARVD